MYLVMGSYLLSHIYTLYEGRVDIHVVLMAMSIMSPYKI